MDSGLITLIYNNYITILALPLVTILVFFIHEFGHYFAARLCGVHVENVSVGFGRPVWMRTDARGTQWSIRLFPFCGFIHIPQKKDDENARSFTAQPVWKRFVIVAAGPIANILLAWVLFTIYFVAAGQPSTPPFVTGVEIGSPADIAGFEAGDRVLSLNGKPVKRFDDVSIMTKIITGEPLRFLLQRGDEIFETQAAPVRFDYTDKEGISYSRGRIGALPQHQPMVLSAIASIDGIDTDNDPDRARALIVDRLEKNITLGLKSVDGKIHDYKVNLSAEMNKGLLDPDSEGYNQFYLGRTGHNFYLDRGLLGSMGAASEDTARLVSGVFKVIGRIGQVNKELVAPEARVPRDVSALRHSLFIVFYAGICLSLSIAVINLMPIPGFDGYYLLRYAVEALVGPARAEIFSPYVSGAAIAVLAVAFMLVNIEALASFIL